MTGAGLPLTVTLAPPACVASLPPLSYCPRTGVAGPIGFVAEGLVKMVRISPGVMDPSAKLAALAKASGGGFDEKVAPNIFCESMVRRAGLGCPARSRVH